MYINHQKNIKYQSLDDVNIPLNITLSSPMIDCFSSSIFSYNFLFKVSGNREIIINPITETPLKIIIGFIFIFDIELNTN